MAYFHKKFDLFRRPQQNSVSSAESASSDESLPSQKKFSFIISKYRHQKKPPKKLRSRKFFSYQSDHDKCTICKKKFVQSKSLITHLRLHTRRASLPFSSANLSKEDSCQCQFCSKIYMVATKRKVHEKLHFGIKPFSCSTCHKAFAMKWKLRQHEQRFHQNLMCIKCGKCYSSMSALSRHKKTHSQDKDMLFLCNVCQKGFARSDVYKEHLLIHQKIKKPFACTLCEKGFTTKANLRLHIKDHEGKNKFECPICHKCFLRKHLLRQHSLIHDANGSFQCKSCDKTFSSKRTLNRHSKTHNPGKGLVCKYCEKVFSRKDVLKEHVRTHTGTKPFRCHLCEKTFSQRNKLDNHQKYHCSKT